MNNQKTIVIAAGCFWGVQKYFQNISGVINTIVGYCGGNYPNPTYELVLQHRNNYCDNFINHTEALQIDYLENTLSTENLIKLFWQIHNPTQLNKQGNDMGNNYRSAIFWVDKQQKKIITLTKDIYQQKLNKSGFGSIVTEILKLDRFYPAEDYHQNYLIKNPLGYCPNNSTGITF